MPRIVRNGKIVAEYPVSSKPEPKRSREEAEKLLEEIEAILEDKAPVKLEGAPSSGVAPVKPSRKANIYLDKSYFGVYIKVDDKTRKLVAKVTAAARKYTGILGGDLIYLGNKKWQYVNESWVWKNMFFVKTRELPREKLIEKLMYI